MANEMFERGLAVRKEVLGAEHVERSLASADDFSRPYQEAITEYCWGAIWNRPGLTRKTRSLLNLAMLTALNRELGLTILMVTHEPDIAAYAQRTIGFLDGHIESDTLAMEAA